MTETVTPADPQDRVRHIVALLNAATTELLQHPSALDRAVDLLDLHTVEAQLRLHLDAAHQDIPAVLVTDRPGVLLDEALQLMETLPEADRATLHGAYLVLVRATGWAGDLG